MPYNYTRKQVIAALEIVVRDLWERPIEQRNRPLIDAAQDELTSLRNAQQGPIVLPDKWCCSTGEWFNKE
jgi:hypothetical protein